ncbi:MAG: hypothetical protein KGL39_19840 [Patescibacteria group bacterium]|nr:hypothetical protein [Patescibacteria group bacterium]
MFDILGIASLILGGVGAIGSISATDQANKVAGEEQQKETQLLNEAIQTQKQEQEQTNLISQRTAQEQALHPANQKFDASGSILTSPLGLLGGGSSSGTNKPLQLLGT